MIALTLAPFMILAADGERRRLAAAVFAGSVAACFGASALYHRVTWTPRVRLWMRRIDHAGVYLLIAGTYTPVSLLVLEGTWRPASIARLSCEHGLWYQVRTGRGQVLVK